MFTSLSYVPLIAPSTTTPRIKFLASIADTFIYVVSKVRFFRRHSFILLMVIPIRWVLQDPMKRSL
jgi:hypothetical protein